MVSVRSLIDGIGEIVRAPLVIIAAVLLTMLAAAPFGVMLRSELREALAHQPPIDLGSGEIDVDWWSELRAHADGLTATFTPTVIGFAAPLDNISTVLDGTRRPLILAVPVLAGVVAWALIWGVALRRFERRRGLPFRDAAAGAFATLPRFLLVSAVAAAAQLALYVSLHPVLFDMAYPALVTDATTEQTAFAIRMLLYAIFWIPVATVSLVADYARVVQIVERPDGVGTMFGTAVRFVRENYGAVASLYVLTGVLFLIGLAGYGALDIAGGSRVGGWRGVALGQAFIVGRITIRLLFGASEISLFKALRI